MGAETGIAWTDHTFNPWWGCQRVSPGCENCYAETWDRRWGGAHWGPQTERRFFGDAHWNEPRKWDREAASRTQVREGPARRARVFCASMADVFEDRRDLDAQRERLWRLIAETPNLDWQLLTKRPENMRRFLPPGWLQKPRSNVWLGTTVEDQQRADERIPHLVQTPAAVRFLSCEPLLQAVSLRWLPAFPESAPYVAQHPSGKTDHLDGLRRIDWVIVGGESGPGARDFRLRWARALVQECREAKVAVFVKQLGASVWEDDADTHPPESIAAFHGVKLKDAKGGDPAEWPADLRVRAFPPSR